MCSNLIMTIPGGSFLITEALLINTEDVNEKEQNKTEEKKMALC